MDGDGQIQKMNVDLQDHLDRMTSKIETDIKSKCEIWSLELAALRREWELEHKNLIQRYEASESAKALAKIEVDRHFETINSLQNRMDKLSESFATKAQVDTLRSWVLGGMVSLVVLLVMVVIDIMRKGS